MVKLIQPSMAGGEVSAPVGARVDLAKRQVAAERAENFVASFTGSMMSRPGTRFVARCKPGAGPHRIIEFEFNDTQTFVIEMGDQYLRFHALGAQVLDSSAINSVSGVTQADPAVVTTAAAHNLSNGDEVFVSGVSGMTQLNGRNFRVANVTSTTFSLQTLDGADVDSTAYTAYASGGTATPPYEVASPWAAADLFRISYSQSGDVLTLCHPDYPPQELVRISNDNWELAPVTFSPTEPSPTAISATVNTEITSGAITGATQADPCVITAASHGLTTGDRVQITGVVGMVELNRFVYSVTVVNANEFSIAYVDNGDVDSTGFTAYSSGGTWTLALRERTYTVTAVNVDDAEESLRGTGEAISVAAVTQADPGVVTTSEGHGLSDLDEVEILDLGGMTELNGERFEVRVLDATTFSLQRQDGTPVDTTAFGAYTSGGEVYPLFTSAVASADAEWDNTLTWVAAQNAQYYNVYATDSFGTLGFIGTTTKTRFDDLNLGPDYARTPPVRYDPFDDFIDGTDAFPGATGFFGQRRWFANSNSRPNRFWASQLGHFSNLSRSIPPLSTDSIVASIAARRINEIKHIVPLTDLIFLTSGGEYRVRGGEDNVISPASINVSPQSYYGSTDLRPIVAGDVGLFVSPGEFVRDLSFDIQGSKFVGRDITVLARHLFDARVIVDWDYAPSPYALGFLCMDDGAGLFLTYQPDQDVYAWTRATTRGNYKSTCVVREGTYDVTYVLVERPLAGGTATFVERMDERQFTDLQDAFHVDCGLTLDQPIAISGVTNARPVVITAPGHGLSEDDLVDISGVYEVDLSQNRGKRLSETYNGTGFTAKNVTANTFELWNAGSRYDGSDFAVYSSGGEVRKAVTAVSGLWHLEGETVVAAANGYVERDLVVSQGTVTLQNPASRVHIGLPYTSQLITLPLASYGSQTEISGRSKNLSRLTVQVEKTMGMWYGPSTDQMREARFGLPARWGQPLPMVTEDIDVTLRPDWGKKKQVVIEQRDPLPLTVLALIPDMTLGGN